MSSVTDYCIGKAGLDMMGKCMAQDFAARGVRVNAVLPGPTVTVMCKEAFGEQDKR